MMTDFKILKKVSKDLTLLFVEDDNTLRKQTSKIFSNLFKLVDVAENGQEGLDHYSNYSVDTGKYYDIVVSDIEMPYIDGIQLSKKILKKNKNQKIVIMSAYDDKEYFSSLIKMGVENFIQKPLSTENLLDIMYKVCIELNNKKSFGDGYYFNDASESLFHDEDKIDISKKEASLLKLLLTKKGDKITKNEIFEYIAEHDIEENTSEDSVGHLVKKLTEKLPNCTIIYDEATGCSLDPS